MKAFRMQKIQTLLFAIMVTLVLSAGTLSARQLRSESNGFACGTTCRANGPGHFQGCSTGCFCNLLPDGTGFCSRSSQTQGK